MAFILYCGGPRQVQEQLSCRHTWHGPCIDEVSRFSKCTKCFAEERDLANFQDYLEVKRILAEDAKDKLNRMISREDQVERLLHGLANRQGHALCHFEPEALRELCRLFDVQVAQQTELPPRLEFRQRCYAYEAEVYGGEREDQPLDHDPDQVTDLATKVQLILTQWHVDEVTPTEEAEDYALRLVARLRDHGLIVVPVPEIP